MKKEKNTMLNTKQQEFVKHAYEKFGKSQLSVDELKQANKKFGCKYAPQWLIKNKDYKVGKSLFKLPVDGESQSVAVNNNFPIWLKSGDKIRYKFTGSCNSNCTPKVSFFISIIEFNIVSD